MKNKKNILNISSAFVLIVFLSVILTNCSESSDIDSGTGTGGSLNQFTIADSFLYVINKAHIETFKIDRGQIDFIAASYIDTDIETVYPFEDLVLVGGRLGMYICERSSDGSLKKISQYEHIESCDPVVTDGKYAYVTLSSGCRAQFNQLDILDVSDPFSPLLLKTYPMENPKGLGIDGALLFICDTSAGLKIYDRTDPVNVGLIYTFDHLIPFDVIPYQGHLFVMTESSIHLFDYNNPDNIFELSVTLLQ